MSTTPEQRTAELSAIVAAQGTVDITPNFAHLRRFMRLVWADPANVIFRQKIRADRATRAFLEHFEPLPAVDRCAGCGRPRNEHHLGHSYEAEEQS